MKKTLFIWLCGAALCGCCGKSYTLTGTVANAGDSIYLLTADRSQELISSTAPDDKGGFRFEGKCETPSMALLASSDYSPLTLVFLEKGKLTLREREEGGYAVDGSPANEALQSFQQAMNIIQDEYFALNEETATPERIETLQNRADSLTKAAIENNSDNLFGAYVLANSYYDMTSDEAFAHIGKLSPEIRRTEIIADLEQVLRAKANTEVGKPYIDLTLHDAEGRSVALSSIVGPGKWVLIDFWATWCYPCTQEIPHLKEAYAEFRDKGFEIYGVSLDSDAEAWKKYIAENGMDWVNVLGAENPEARAEVDKYAVQSIPSNFLISPDGEIVATALRGDAVREKLAELLH